MAWTWKATESWYPHRIYVRRWGHYHAMVWMCSLRNVYRKFRDSCFTFPWFSPHRILLWSSLSYEAARPWNFEERYMAWQESRWASSAWPQNPGIHRRRWALHEEEDLELGLDDELECQLRSVEITKELCLYFAETEKEDPDREGRATVRAAAQVLTCHSPGTLGMPPEHSSWPLLLDFGCVPFILLEIFLAKEACIPTWWIKSLSQNSVKRRYTIANTRNARLTLIGNHVYNAGSWFPL